MEENKSEQQGGLLEVKKSKSADLEGKKSTSLLIGYVLVLAAMFVCFEWTQRDKKIDLSDAVQDIVVLHRLTEMLFHEVLDRAVERRHHIHTRVPRFIGLKA